MFHKLLVDIDTMSLGVFFVKHPIMSITAWALSGLIAFHLSVDLAMWIAQAWYRLISEIKDAERYGCGY